MTIKLVAKTLLINQQEKILILRRSPTDPLHPGRLDFPGGSVEPNESISRAAVREIAEEVGLQVDQKTLSLVYSMTAPPNDKGHIIHRFLFCAKAPEGPISLSYEHDKYWWQTPDKILEDFDNTAWRDGLRFAALHQLLLPPGQLT
ncbi:MAG TPA: NUDIX hydrolase [Candidatus Dormibacteraeota bacterium]|nr:NUDIX hydrolase [Candidatus Dormibacteraeota bacterium]